MAEDYQKANRAPRAGNFERLKVCTAAVVDQNSPSGSNIQFFDTAGGLSQLHMGASVETFEINSSGPENRPRLGEREDIVAFVETDGRKTKILVQDGRTAPGSFSSASIEGQLRGGEVVFGTPSTDPHGKKDVNATMAENVKKMANEIQTCTNSSSPRAVKKPVYGFKP